MRWMLALLILPIGCVGAVLGQEADAQLKLEVEQAEQTLKKANIALEDKALLAFFQKKTLSAQDEEKLNQLVLKLGDTSYPARALAHSQLLKFGSLAMPFLQNGLKADDQEIARRAALCLRHIQEHSDSELISAAALILSQRKPEGAAKALLDYLPFAVDEDVIKQVRDALGKVAVKDKKVDPAAVAALADKFAVRRWAAGEALAQAPEHRDAVAELLKDQIPQVRLIVGQALLKARDSRAVPVLIALIDQLPAEDVWQAEEALLRVAGETAPTIDPTKDDKPGKVRKVWDAWHKDHNGEMEKLLKDYAEAGAYLNYLLITQMPMAGGINGEVLELNAKKTEMWKISGLRYPVDAVVIGPKRVLIAEYLNRRVIEMDFKGAVKWSYEIDQPVGVQLLPNGNIFIAARRELVEVTRDHKKKFSHSNPNLFISSARKLPNGHVLMVTNTGQLTHMDAKGTTIKTFPVGQVYTLGGHIDPLPGNRVLVPEYSAHRVAEYTLAGELKWQVPIQWPTCVMRLPNGQTLVTSMIGQQVCAFDNQKTQVWSYKTTGRPWCARAR